MEETYENCAKVFKALSDPKRLHILEILQDGEKCACKLLQEMHMPQSTLSYHMKLLCESGVVTAREEGKWTHFKLNEAGIKKAQRLLAGITVAHI